MVYLDYAATTPVDPEVIQVITAELEADFGNASSLYKTGRNARMKIEKARQVVATSLNVKEARTIVFTSGATEAINTALIQTAIRLKDRGKHLITSQVEHPAVYQTMQYLEEQGFEVTYLPVTESGAVELEAVAQAIRPDTILVSIMYGNNETGAINPIEAIGKLLMEANIFFHCDIVQAYGLEKVDVQALYIDALSISFHKIYGPKGIGCLYYRDYEALSSWMHGGGQEGKRRPGTENTPYIVGASRAVELMVANRDQRKQHVAAIKAYFIGQLRKFNIPFEINGQEQGQGLVHIANIWIKDLLSSKLIILLDMAGIEVSAGSACSAGSLEPSRILIAMYGTHHKRIQESFRVSFGKDTTTEEIDQLVEVINKSIN